MALSMSGMGVVNGLITLTFIVVASLTISYVDKEDWMGAETEINGVSVVATPAFTELKASNPLPSPTAAGDLKTQIEAVTSLETIVSLFAFCQGEANANICTPENYKLMVETYAKYRAPDYRLRQTEESWKTSTGSSVGLPSHPITFRFDELNDGFGACERVERSRGDNDQSDHHETFFFMNAIGPSSANYATGGKSGTTAVCDGAVSTGSLSFLDEDESCRESWLYQAFAQNGWLGLTDASGTNNWEKSVCEWQRSSYKVVKIMTIIALSVGLVWHLMMWWTLSGYGLFGVSMAELFSGAGSRRGPRMLARLVSLALLVHFAVIGGFLITAYPRMNSYNDKNYLQETTDIKFNDKTSIADSPYRATLYSEIFALTYPPDGNSVQAGENLAFPAAIVSTSHLGGKTIGAGVAVTDTVFKSTMQRAGGVDLASASNCFYGDKAAGTVAGTVNSAFYSKGVTCELPSSFSGYSAKNEGAVLRLVDQREKAPTGSEKHIKVTRLRTTEMSRWALTLGIFWIVLGFKQLAVTLDLFGDGLNIARIMTCGLVDADDLHIAGGASSSANW